METFERVDEQQAQLGQSVHSRMRRTLIPLLVVGVAAWLVLALGAPGARAVVTQPIPADVGPTPPPVPVLPEAGETPPPAEAIGDPIEPAAVCGDWYQQSSYGGAWPTASKWWEYECTYAYPQCIGACNADWVPSIWIDYFYWDGASPVFYGEFYGDYYLSSWGWPACEYWWDVSADRWYRFESPTCVPWPPPNAAPTASFTVSCSGLSCDFNGSASTDSDGTIDAYSWTFGDGSGASGTAAHHTYAGAGTYIVTLTVTDNDGASSVDPRSITVTNAAPTVSFVFTCVALSCTFDGGASVDTDGMIGAYDWTFGDGSGASGTAVQHTYAGAGKYTVTLTVTDNGGATGADSKIISPIILSARGYKVAGLQKADLSWSGASGTTVDVYRDSVTIATVQASAYTDNINKRGMANYTYRVCALGSSVCSNETKISF